MLAQCRICLETDDPGTMLTPCACRGTAMYIHRRCLQEHLRHYPDGKCRVCRETMKYTNYAQLLVCGMMFVSLLALLLLSTMDFVVKVFVFISFTCILSALLIRHYVHEELGVFIMAIVMMAFGAATSDQRFFFAVSSLVILFTVFATIVNYIPQEYIAIFIAILFMGLYVSVFMAALVSIADVYGSSVILATILLFWYGWVRSHPPLLPR